MGGIGKRTKRVVAVVLLAGALCVTPARATGIPVIDIIQEVMQAIHEYLMLVDQAMQIYHYDQMLKEGEWFAVLQTLLYQFDEYFPDAEMGQWAATITEARDLYQGASGSYGDAKQLMNRIFGGEQEIRTGRVDMLDFMDAVAVRTSKEIGRYRAGKDARKMVAEQILTKAEGYTGTDRQLQLTNSTLANLLEAMSDQTMKVVTTNELLATMVEKEREQLHQEELVNQTASEGFRLFVDGQSSEWKPIVLP